MKMTVFKEVAPYSLVEIDRRFRCAYCLHHQSDRDSSDKRVTAYGLNYRISISGNDYFLVTTVSNLEYTWLPPQWEPRAHSPGVTRPERERYQ
jgi:hypothetical protein